MTPDTLMRAAIRVSEVFRAFGYLASLLFFTDMLGVSLLSAILLLQNMTRTLTQTLFIAATLALVLVQIIGIVILFVSQKAFAAWAEMLTTSPTDAPEWPESLIHGN